MSDVELVNADGVTVFRGTQSGGGALPAGWTDDGGNPANVNSNGGSLDLGFGLLSNLSIDTGNNDIDTTGGDIGTAGGDVDAGTGTVTAGAVAATAAGGALINMDGTASLSIGAGAGGTMSVGAAAGGTVDLDTAGAGGRIRLNDTGIGFYDAAPVAQPAPIADAAGGAIIDAEARAALNSLLAAVRNLGLLDT